MKVVVDSKALRDLRFRRLARLLGIRWEEALGLCFVAWNYAYEAHSAFISAEDLDAVVERDGFAVAIVASGLAIADGDWLRLRGVEKRIYGGRGRTFMDIAGQRYGRLVAIRYLRRGDERGRSLWLFQCDCGRSKEILADSVRSGRTRSCGCLRAHQQDVHRQEADDLENEKGGN